MRSLADSAYLDSAFDVPVELAKAGSALENPYVFDAAARELKEMAGRGLVEIVGEQVGSRGAESLIERLVFRRLR